MWIGTVVLHADPGFVLVLFTIGGVLTLLLFAYINLILNPSWPSEPSVPFCPFVPSLPFWPSFPSAPLGNPKLNLNISPSKTTLALAWVVEETLATSASKLGISPPPEIVFHSVS